MEAIFTEEMIREELRKLDRKTGLHGADLPIKFGNSRSRLGYFSYRSDDELFFYFSNHYFENPAYPVEGKIDVIRHEYAHYLDYSITGGSSHGPHWKKCCNIVGALPIRCASDERAEFFLMSHEKERQANEKYDKYTVGKTVKHPSFGSGVIKEIVGEGTARSAVILFDKAGTKKLAISWIAEKCG